MKQLRKVMCFPRGSIAGTLGKMRPLALMLILLAAFSFQGSGQQRRDVSGTVRDSNGLPLPGVSVIIKGTTVGTVTNSDGSFSLPVTSDAKALVFSFVGMTPREIPIGNQTVFTVSMTEESIGVDEVVVVGYGVQKKANLTGAVDQVSSEVFENRTVTNVSQGLQGVLPNLNLRMMDGKPIQSPSYNIRGTTSIGQGGSALILIDGVEGDPSLLNPNDIASVSMLKDAASAAIYGARGVIRGDPHHHQKP